MGEVLGIVLPLLFICYYLYNLYHEQIMNYTLTTTVVLYHPETEQEENIWIDAEVTKDEAVHTYMNGEPGHPGSMDIEIMSWGRCLDDTQPEWITNEMLFNALDSMDFDSMDPNDNDDEYELRQDK